MQKAQSLIIGGAAASRPTFFEMMAWWGEGGADGFLESKMAEGLWVWFLAPPPGCCRFFARLPGVWQARPPANFRQPSGLARAGGPLPFGGKAVE